MNHSQTVRIVALQAPVDILKNIDGADQLGIF